MFGEEKNLKDANLPLPNLPLHRGRSEEGVVSYTKTNKLITALYMVTDIIDKDEPLRNKLRTLGAEIILDMHSAPSNILVKISQVMSFLDIASAINIISEMNTNILKKEFAELNQSILSAQTGTGSTDKIENPNRQINLSEFFTETPLLGKEGVGGGNSKNHHLARRALLLNKEERNPKGHTRLGVQKGSTLMSALSDKTQNMSNTNSPSNSNHLNVLKKQRREEIKDSIRANGNNAAIKDIKDKAQGSLISCGEKTLQRELISMVQDGILSKEGSKRWSRYSLKISPPPPG